MKKTILVIMTLLLLGFAKEAKAQMLITNVNDISAGTWSGFGGIDLNDDICVYRLKDKNRTNYSVTVTGITTDNGLNYAIQNTMTGEKAKIRVYWNTSSGTAGRVEIFPNTTPSRSNLSGADNVKTDCRGGTNANFSWSALETDLQAMSGGHYTASFSIMVEPF